MDIVFVLDSSGSIQQAEFFKMEDLVRSVVSDIDIPGGSRAGIVVFSTAVHVSDVNMKSAHALCMPPETGYTGCRCDALHRATLSDISTPFTVYMPRSLRRNKVHYTGCAITLRVGLCIGLQRAILASTTTQVLYMLQAWPDLSGTIPAPITTSVR